MYTAFHASGMFAKCHLAMYLLVLQNIFCYETVQELGGKAGIISKDMPVLCKPSKHVSRKGLM